MNKNTIALVLALTLTCQSSYGAQPRSGQATAPAITITSQGNDEQAKQPGIKIHCSVDEDASITPEKIAQEQIQLINYLTSCIGSEARLLSDRLLYPNRDRGPILVPHKYAMTEVLNKQAYFNKKYAGSQKAVQAGVILNNDDDYTEALVKLQKAVSYAAGMEYNAGKSTKANQKSYKKYMQDIEGSLRLLEESPVFAK